MDSPVRSMLLFTPGKCLFCPNISPTFTDSVTHMQNSHGLFVPDRQHLAVDLKTLFEYLYLVIFGYRECIQCGTSKASVQAVQQHMTSKGHCKFDISEQDSEFAEFYDFSELDDNTKSGIESDDNERNEEDMWTSPSRKPLMVNQDSIELPSGRIIFKKLSTQAERSLLSRLKRRNRTMASRIEYYTPEADDKDGSNKEEHSDIDDTTILSKRQKQEKAKTKFQLTYMSANDQRSMMHLPAPQQLSILAMQHRQVKRAQKEDRRRQSHIDRKGNKNLYAYWDTETPVYLCG
uniref:Cytoplasmic 60S subunit biogenesis factor REI1 like n=1 Tax=Talaromyces marneffei PM1 TaxID=1077442 RepID=A0A093VSP2_TALMA